VEIPPICTRSKEVSWYWPREFVARRGPPAAGSQWPTEVCVGYAVGMTRRITISLPDDVAAFVDQHTNASGFITEVVRGRMTAEALRERLAQHGVVVTDAGVQRCREQMAAMPPVTPTVSRRRRSWLTQFGTGAASGAA
jgi:hypothetical protein